MSLQNGAERIVHQCLNIGSNEDVVLVNDGTDEDLINVLREVVETEAESLSYVTYEEPEHHGTEPPDRVREEMVSADVFIAPTKKSISHTEARRAASEAGTRGATMPGVTKEIWNTSLQADYYKVEKMSNYVYDRLSETDEVTVETSSGTRIRLEVNIDYFHRDTGIIHKPGQFGNLPAGEADGGVENVRGHFVVDHFPFSPRGTKLTIEESTVTEVQLPEQAEQSELLDAFENVEGARNVAEFGFGTNPEATLIGNILQDEKVLGTVHLAFGDNTSYMPEDHPRYVSSEIHWDSVCEDPTVHFDERIMLDEGKPVFLDQIS